MAKDKEKIKAPRFQEIREAYKITKSARPWIGVALLGVFFGTLTLVETTGVLIWGRPIYTLFLALGISLVSTLIFFTRTAQSSMYAALEGQLGAGASVIMGIRKGWTTTPAIAVNRNQDMVHRSVGRPGIVLTAEGGSAVRQMLSDERKKTERYAPGAPIIEVIVGDGDGQVPLKKLQKHLQRLPKKLSQHQVRELRARLKAVGGMSLPIPKGPMPKGVRIK